MQEKKEVRVGVGVWIERDGKILLGKRKNAHGEGTWSPPGGHLEMNESVIECAAREVMEEAGLVVISAQKIGYTEDIFEQEKKHYITLWVKAVCEEGEPRVCEPHKCEEWRWFSLSELPSQLFTSLKNFLQKSMTTAELADEIL